MRTATIPIKQSEINAAITEVVNQLAPHVLYVRYNFGEDWSGDAAIFFRVVLSDDVGDQANFINVASDVERRISDKLDFLAMGLFGYFNFRLQSEQAVMQDPEWA
jgi:hypothetical protein